MSTPEEPRPLTAKQAAILNYIREHSTLTSPTFRQIASAFGFKSPHAVTVHVDALEKKGAIRRNRGQSRCIEVLS